MNIAEIGYTAVYIFLISVVVITYRNALARLGRPLKQIKRRTIILLIAFIGWTVYLYFIGESGLLWNFELPPRFPLLIFLPLALTFLFIFIMNRKSPVFNAISKANVIHFQSFRIIIEWVILATYLEGVFPIETTFEGYNYEIVIGALAPLVAYGVYRKQWFSEKLALWFNFLGLTTLAIIIFIVITSLYIPEFWGDSSPRIREQFTKVPYLFLPGLIAPIAIFTHIFSIIQIRKSLKSPM